MVSTLRQVSFLLLMPPQDSGCLAAQRDQTFEPFCGGWTGVCGVAESRACRVPVLWRFSLAFSASVYVRLLQCVEFPLTHARAEERLRAVTL